MTIDSAFEQAIVALPAQRTARPATRPLPLAEVAAEPETPAENVGQWRTAVAVLAGLLGGALMVAGVVLPW